MAAVYNFPTLGFDKTLRLLTTKFIEILSRQCGICKPRVCFPVPLEGVCVSLAMPPPPSVAAARAW